MPDDTPRSDVLTRARELRDDGASYETIARALQAEGYPTQRGGRWVGRGTSSLLNGVHPHAAFLVPCSVCGDLTASKWGVCHDRPECVRVYLSVSTDHQRKKHPTKPCGSCGRPTTSDLGICGRLSCRNERMRVFRISQKGAPSVYAVWFPSPRILKIGFSLNTTDSIVEGGARKRARNRNWDADGSHCIWRGPGDTRTEAWMQATLAFRWQSAYRETSGRICEWFSVPPILTVDEVVTILGSVYRLVPPDLRGGGLAALEQQATDS